MAGQAPVSLVPPGGPMITCLVDYTIDPARTAALGVSSLLPTGEMIRNSSLLVAVDPVRQSIARYTRPDATRFVDARRIAEGLFGDHMATNLFAVGAAYQAGLLPLQAESIEGAILKLRAVKVAP